MFDYFEYTSDFHTNSFHARAEVNNTRAFTFESHCNHRVCWWRIPYNIDEILEQLPWLKMIAERIIRWQLLLLEFFINEIFHPKHSSYDQRLVVAIQESRSHLMKRYDDITFSNLISTLHSTFAFVIFFASFFSFSHVSSPSYRVSF